MNSAKLSAAAKAKEIQDHILGKDYDLSLVFCKNPLSHKLNLKYRGKDKPTNVLAFPLSKNSGEIFINRDLLKPFGVLHLFIHGCLHLKGFKHGRRMEEAEKTLIKRFSESPHVTRSRRN